MSRLRFSNLSAFFIIFLVAFAVYGQGLFNEFILGDDYDQIVNNSLLTSPQKWGNFLLGSTYYLPESAVSFGLFYRPLMLINFGILYFLFGANPIIFHVWQLILHILSSFILYLVINKLLKSRKFSLSSLLMSMLFLVHPINSETVLHSANLQEVLMGLIGLLSLWLFLNKRNYFWIGLSLLLCLLAKESGIIWFFVIFSLNWWRSKKINLSLLGMMSLSFAGYLCLRFLAQVSYSIPNISLIANLTTSERLRHVPIIIFKYLNTYIWPGKLVTQQFWIIPDISFSDWIRPLFLIITGGAFLLFVTHRFIKEYKYIWSWSWSWLIVVLLIHSQIIPLYVTIAERWFYLGSMVSPVIILIGWINFPSKVRLIFFKPALSLVMIILVTLAVRTNLRSKDWRNTETLLLSDIGQVSHDFYNQNLLASWYLLHNQHERAYPYIASSISIHEYVGNLSNWGVVNLHYQNFQIAEIAFQKSLNLGQTYQSVLNYLNYLVLIKNDYILGEKLSNQYLKNYPSSGELWMLLSICHYQTGQKAQAINEISIAKKLLSNKLILNLEKQILAGEKLEFNDLIIY